MFQRALDAQFYVDRSALVSFMNGRMGLDSGFVAVSRPRRFGKSVDANMLVAYYSRGCDSRAQFESLTVAQDSSFNQHLNAHDVIHVDVQRLIGLGGGIQNLVETFEEEVLEDLEEAWPDLMPRRRRLIKALAVIAEAKGSGFVFVIDEWDCPMREAADDEPLQRRWLDFLRELQRRTLEGDAAYVADAVRRAHNSAAGPHYYNDEQALRAAVKLAFIWSIDDYLRVDELGAGRGYADLAYIPKPGSKLPPMVVELKWDEPTNAALTQIRKRNYPAAFAGLSGPCVLVGITYRKGTDEHECIIEQIQL